MTQNAKNWGFRIEIFEKKVWFEISTFEIRYRQNFVKIKKLIPFGPKRPNLEVWAQTFRERMSHLQSAPLGFVSAGFGSFRLVSARFGWFQVVLLVLGFSKYENQTWISWILCTFCWTKCLHIFYEVLLIFYWKFSLHANKIGIIFSWNRFCFWK